MGIQYTCFFDDVMLLDYKEALLNANEEAKDEIKVIVRKSLQGMFTRRQSVIRENRVAILLRHMTERADLLVKIETILKDRGIN